MDFSRGYSASFYATIVDRNSWLDDERFEIVSGSIERSTTDLRQSASLNVREWPYENDVMIRIYMDASQGESREHVPLFTGIASAPSSNFNNGVTDISLQCYSILKPAQDILLERGWYALKGSNGADIISSLLAATHTTVDIDREATPPILSSSIVAEDDETNLSMIEYILESIGWSLIIDGMGNVMLEPISDEPILSIDSVENDVIETSFSRSNDWFNCPNVIMVTSGDSSFIYRDENEDSKFSIPNRGREIWEIDNENTIAESESLESYAKRRLREMQEETETIQYRRRFLPNIYPDDMIRINYPELQGDYYIESQSINLGVNAQTSENLYRYL